MGDNALPDTLVSIVIPTYNSAATLAQTLRSCQQQTYPQTEIIVIDDGSSDDTVAIAESFAQNQNNENIRIITQANSGPAVARNRGVEEANGAWVQFCDSDDILLPTKIEQSARLLAQHPQAALAYTQMQPVAADDLTPLDVPPVPDVDFFKQDDCFCRILQANGSPIQTSTWLVRKAAFVEVGGFRDDPQMHVGEDWEFLLRLSARYAFVGVPEILVQYRQQRDEALSTDPYTMATGRLQAVRYAGEIPRLHECMDEAAYARLLAGRYHVRGAVNWRRGNRSQARDDFLHAARLTSDGRYLRWLYAAMTYLLPAQAMDTLAYTLARLR